MADHDHSSTRRKKPWLLTFFGLFAVGGLIAMPFLAGSPAGGEVPDLVRFLGHFHPLLLHLPIGVFALILFQELGAILGKCIGDPKNTALFPLFFGASSAIAAVIAGFLLYQGEANFSESVLVERHLWGGLIFAIAAVVTFISKAWTVALLANPAFYRMLLLGSVGVMGFASHDGASITHGENYLTEFAPESMQRLLGSGSKRQKEPKLTGAPAKAPVEQLVYAEIVAPILERRCLQCHKENKSKGKFRMDSYELLLKGGNEGAAIKPGKSADSNIIIRMALPKDDDEHMPPRGKPEIESTEVAVIKWWIDNGANPQQKLSDSAVTAPVREAIAKLYPVDTAGSSKSTKIAAQVAFIGPDEKLKAAVAVISKEFPGALRFESQNSALLAFTAVSLRGNLDDTTFKKLESVSSQLVTVDLSATKITDLAIAQLALAKNLRLVRLAETGVTNASIDTLLKLASLESINLYGTKVTDAGVSKLSAMPNLKRLYLWRTAVTPECIKALKEKLPSCEIITGV